jgi:hypothetical protein
VKTIEEMQNDRRREKWEDRLNSSGGFKRAFWTVIYGLGRAFSFGQWAPLKKVQQAMANGDNNKGKAAVEPRSSQKSAAVTMITPSVSVSAKTTTPPNTVGFFSEGKGKNSPNSPLKEFALKLVKSLTPAREKSLNLEGQSIWRRILEHRKAISHANQDNHNIQVRWYSDNDITEYVATVIRHDKAINGFVDGSECLLRDQPRGEILAICDAVDSVGLAMPINYFLNKSVVLLANERREKDVFTELMPQLLQKPLSTHIHEARILFPYNKTQTHWLAGEIKIKKILNQQYEVEVYSHDPYGGGQMTDSAYKTIRQTVIQRIQEEIPGADVKVKNMPSPYKRRQAANDGASCGPITAETILDIIRFGAPQNIPFYPSNAVELRQKQADCMKDLLPSSNGAKTNFLMRNTKTGANRKSIEDLPTSLVEKMAGLINGIENEKLKSGIFSGVFEQKDIENEANVFWQCIISAVEDIPTLLSSDGEILSDKDLDRVNELFLDLLPIKELLFDEQQKLLEQKSHSYTTLSL